MLIYNHKKEFVGIDAHDLNTFGYKSLNTLLEECNDFAELFVKTPGHIHDFKHVHWIDFITCGQSNEDTKAIIHANGKTYRAIITIESFYLLSESSEKAYSVNFSNVRELTKEESQNISDDILDRPVKAPRAVTSSYEEPEESVSIQEEDTYEATPQPEPTPSAMPEPEPRPAPVEDLKLDLDMDEDEVPDFEPVREELVSTPEPSVEDDFKIELEDDIEEISSAAPEIPADDDFVNDYVYDPHVASDELGLPIDLIEEFIQDFINQAYEFKDELYESLNDGELDKVRILSHKLKGVAANLRIEDAFDVLVIVNTDNDVNKVSTNLNRFYRIIAKLAGEETPEPAQTAPAPEPEPVVEETQTQESSEVAQDEIAIDLEDEPKIEIDESLDDDIFADPVQEQETQEESISLEIEDDPIDDDIFAVDDTPTTLKKTQQKQEAQLDLDDPIDDDIFAVDDSEVPDKIEVAELADDTFEEHFAEDTSLDIGENLDSLELDLEESTPAPKSFAQTYTPSYNKKTVASEIGLDQESFEFLFNDYVEESKQALEQMRQSFSSNNLQILQKEAVKLNGMSENMRIRDFKEELDLIKQTQNAQEISSALDSIEMKLAALSKIEG